MAARVLRLGGFAAAASSALAAAGAADEVAMVQASVEFASAGRLEQFPGAGDMNIGDLPMPSPNMSGMFFHFGDMTPMINQVKQLDDTFNALRDPKLFGKIQKYGYDVRDAFNEKMAAGSKEVQEIADGSAETPLAAAVVAANILLKYREYCRTVVNMTRELADPLNNEVNNHFKVDNLFGLFSYSFVNRTEKVVYNTSGPILESLANGTLQDVDHATCQEFGVSLWHLSKGNHDLKGNLTELEEVPPENMSHNFAKNSLVLIRPDVVPQLKAWVAQEANISSSMLRSVTTLLDLVVDKSLRLLNDVADCKINEEHVLMDSAARRGGGSLLLASLAALLAAVLGSA